MCALSITHRARTLWCAALVVVVACSGTEPVPVTTGTARVTTATAGADLDPDGYTVALDNDSTGTTQPVAINGSVTFSRLIPGSHSLTLRGTTANCLVAGANSQTVSVVAGQTAEVTFHVTCVRRVALAGVWNYVEQFGNPLACNDTGSFVLTGTSDEFGGTDDLVGTCDRQDGSVDHAFSGPVSGILTYSATGPVSVNLSVGGCSYSADVAGAPSDRLINGAIQCSSGTGTWTAVRGGGAVTDVSVSPATRSIVTNGTARLRAIMLDASGSRRVGPVVTWTSDAPAIASVDASGVLTGVAPGSATITATADSKSGRATVGVEVVTFATVAAGAFHSCGLTTSGAAYCWGHGTYGQIGDGGTADALAPEAISNISGLTAISVGAVHSCGLTPGGVAYCWGSDLYGTLGAGVPAARVCGMEGGPCSTTPVAVIGGHAFSALSAGWAETCALTQAGAAYCWGDDTYGELGNGSAALTRTPVAVTGAHTFVSIASGNVFACGLTVDSAAYCWGNNAAGQLGIGPTSPRVCSNEPCSTAPVAVSGGLTFTTLSVGYWHACGLTSSGAMYCWGDNDDGQLGASTSETCAGLACSTVPLPVAGALQFAQLSAGSFHTCGVTAAGAGYCWGNNADGQLGNGTTTRALTPAPIAGGFAFAAVSAFGRYHSCGLSADGIAYCWGYNAVGALGDGTTFGAYGPVRVAGQAGASAPAALRVGRRGRIAPRFALPLSARPPSP